MNPLTLFIKGDNNYYSKERVLIRETGSTITCVYLNYEILSTRSLYSILPINEISPKYIISLLCSKLIQFYYVSEFMAETNVFPKIRIAQVKNIPIKEISLEEQQPFIYLVDKILAKKEMVGQSSVIDNDKSNIDNVQGEIKNYTKQAGMPVLPNGNETKQARMPVLPNGNETKQAGMPVLPNDNDSTAEEREIDMLVYKLYDLTDEEIKIIEGN